MEIGVRASSWADRPWIADKSPARMRNWNGDGGFAACYEYPSPLGEGSETGVPLSPTCQSEYTRGNTLPLLYIELRERKKSDLLPLEKSHFPITKTQHAVSLCPWKYSLQSGTSAFHGSCRTSTAKLRFRETLRSLRSALAHKVPHQPRQTCILTQVPQARG